MFKYSQIHNYTVMVKRWKALVMNNVQLIMPSLSKFTSIAPQMQLLIYHFIFRDKRHLYNVMDGEVENFKI